MYSLVSAPVLGFDLARLQGGSAVADVLLQGLTITVSDIAMVASHHSTDWSRANLWQDVDAAAQQRRAMRVQSAEAGASAENDGDGGEAPDAPIDPAIVLASAVVLLERTPIGTVDGLLHCLRYDVLDWTWSASPPGVPAHQHRDAERASAVLCDALAAAYLRDLLPDEARRQLSAPWVAASRKLSPPKIDLGPQQATIQRLLDRVGAMSPTEMRRVVRASDQARGGLGNWAPAVHSASWAVFLSSRVRSAAAAQLLLVQAIDRAGISVPDRAGGVWNLLSGAVQALMVRDLLDSATVHRLLEPYFAAMGPLATD